MSDRCSSGETKDISGLYLKTVIDNAKSDLNMVFAERACVPDEIPIISVIIVSFTILKYFKFFYWRIQ